MCKLCFIFKYIVCYVVSHGCFRAEFEFTSQYVVQVDDFFLHYLQKVCCCSLLLYVIYQIY